MVSPSALRMAIEVSTDSGMDSAMIKRAAPRAEEQQNHQRRQRRGDDAFPHDAGDGRADEERLVGEFLHLKSGGERRSGRAAWPP